MMDLNSGSALLDHAPCWPELTAGSAHFDHAPCWLIQTEDPATAASCLACLAELLEEKQITVLKKKTVLEKVLQILQSNGTELQALLRLDPRVANHFCLLLLEMTMVADAAVSSMATEGVIGLVTLLKSEELVVCVLNAISQEVLERSDHKGSLPLLTLLGHLLSVLPEVVNCLATDYAVLVDFASVGLLCPDEAVQVAVTYLFVQLCGHSAAVQLLLQQLHTCRQLIQGLLHVLHRAKSYQLQLNSLGLLKTVLEKPQLATLCIQEKTADQGTLASAIKKILLQRREPLQIAVVQCLVVALQREPQYVAVLLQDDIPEFLFEALNSSSELLIESILCSLVLFMENDAFFNKCHAVYGLDSILRGLEQLQHKNNVDAQIHALTLIARILDKYDTGVSFFGQRSSLLLCLKSISQASVSTRTRLVSGAAHTLTSLLRWHQQPRRVNSLPLAQLTDCLKDVVVNLQRHFSARQAMPLDLSATPGQASDTALGQIGVADSKTPDTARNLQQGLGLVVGLLLAAAKLARSCEASDADSTSQETQSASAAAAAAAVSSQNSQKVSVDSTTADTDNDSTSNSYQTFVQCLLQLLEQTCLHPAALQTLLSYNPDHQVSFFSLLCHALYLSGPRGMAFTQSLITGGVFTEALAAKRRQGPVSQLQETANTFVFDILSNVLIASEGKVSAELLDVLRCGLKSIEGSLEDVLNQMTSSEPSGPEAETVVTDQEAVRTAALLVVFAVFSTGSWNADSRDLRKRLTAYINHCPDSLASLPAFKYIVFLYAAVTLESARSFKKEVSMRVTEAISRSQSSSPWCLHHPLMLDWCFQDPATAQLCGTQMLEHWLSHEDYVDNSTELTGHLQTLTTTNVCCVSAVLELAQSTQPRTVQTAAQVLHNILSEDHQIYCSPDVREVIQTQLPAMVSRSLLRFEDKDNEAAVAVGLMLELYFHLKRSCQYRGPLGEVDLKIAYQAAKLVADTEATGSCSTQQQRLVQEGLNVLCSLLTQSTLDKDSRVTTILVKNEQLVGYLARRLTDQRDNRHQKSLLIVAVMLHHHHLHRLQLTDSQQTITLSLSDLIQSCLITATGNTMDATLSLLFWTAFLQGGHLTGLVKVHRRGGAYSEGAEPDQLSEEDLCTLMILSQQCLLMENTLLKEMAVCCMQALFEYAEEDKHLEFVLRRQPWHDMVLSHALLLSGEPWLLRLATLLLKKTVKALRGQSLGVLIEACLGDESRDWGTEQREFLAAVCKMNTLELDSDLVKAAKVKVKRYASASKRSQGQGQLNADLLSKLLPDITTAVTGASNGCTN